MEAQIHYGHIGRTQALEDYIYQHLQKIIDKSSAADNYRFEVWMDNENDPHFSLGAPRFCTSIRVVSPRGEEIFVKKQDENFYRAFRKCQDSILKELRRAHKIRRTRA